MKDKGENLGVAVEWSREIVVNEIGKVSNFITIFKYEDGKWRKGDFVHIVNTRGQSYIRKDRNMRQADNLENLPTY